MAILEVENLSKQFGSFTAVDDVSFALSEGEILGFLGPNGAGKTTTIQMLLGVLTPSKGAIKYFGKDFKSNRTEILEQVNFSSTYTNLPWTLTVKENLTFMSYLYKIKDRKARVAYVAEIFKLNKILHKQVDELSAGQITRLNLAKALLNFPKVLLLDEPTASLDPDVASYIREFLQEERKKFNVSILITSHNMAEVEEVCDRVVFINHGKIVANDTPDKLIQTIEICHIELLVSKGMKELTDFLTQEKIVSHKQGKHIVIDVREKQVAAFLQDIGSRGVVYEEISIDKPTLEDYFLQNAKIRQ